MNPWILAGLVFAGIGLLLEAVQSKEDKEAAAATKLAATKKAAKKKAKPAPKVVPVETHPQPPVVVESASKTAVVKPIVEVPTDTPKE